MVAQRRRIYEGKNKVIYEGTELGTLVQYFKDDSNIEGFDANSTITGKGVLNNRISEYLMNRIADIGIPTHLIRRLNMREQLIREVEIIPIKVVVRNMAAGSLAKRLAIEEGASLPRSIIEYYYKSDELETPMVSDEHITAFGWASSQELDEVMSMSLRANDFLMGLFYGVGIRLIDFKLEFGRYWQGEEIRIILADEISPDSCRLWDLETDERLDSERARLSIGEAAAAYQEVARRLGILPESDVINIHQRSHVNI